jgi:hypothetical protein
MKDINRTAVVKVRVSTITKMEWYMMVNGKTISQTVMVYYTYIFTMETIK